MRTFIALPFAEYFQKLLYDERSLLRDPNPRLKWIPPENFHLTLHFLGDLSLAAANDVAEILEMVSHRMEPFELKTSGPDQFPHKGQPRIIYEGIEQGKEECRRLHRWIGNSLSELGITLEHHRYIPHISLCRLNRRTVLQPSFATLPLRLLETTIDSIALFQSTLHPAGAIYEILEEFTLKGRAEAV